MSKILSASVKFDPDDNGPEPYAEIEVIVYEPGLPMHLPCQLRSHNLTGLHGWWCADQEQFNQW